MRLAILLFCSFLFAQSNSPTPETKSQAPANSGDQKQQPPAKASPNDAFGKYAGGMTPGSAIQQAAQAVAAHHEQESGPPPQDGHVDILSDTRGVNFRPYLASAFERVRQNWYRLIPASAQTKRGKLAIEFAITKDGKVKDMRLVATSGDVGLDRPAWRSITESNPFPPLPAEFTGPYLALRFRFYYNPDKSDLAAGLAQSGIAVSISPPTDLRVPVGGSAVVTATVTGTKEQAVEWSVIGSGCSGAACGKMQGGVYVAPSARPNPPDVTLTASSKADPSAKASVTVHIVQPAQPQ